MAGILSRVGLQPQGELVLVTYHARGASAPGPVLVFHCFPSRNPGQAEKIALK